MDSLTAPIVVIVFSPLRSSSSSVLLSGYIGTHGGVLLSLKLMAWSYAECWGSSKEASVDMMGMNSACSLGTQLMAACSCSSIAATDVRRVSFSRCSCFPSVHLHWQSAEVNLMCPLRASRSHLCFASLQRGRSA